MTLPVGGYVSGQEKRSEEVRLTRRRWTLLCIGVSLQAFGVALFGTTDKGILLVGIGGAAMLFAARPLRSAWSRWEAVGLVVSVTALLWLRGRGAATGFDSRVGWMLIGTALTVMAVSIWGLVAETARGFREISNTRKKARAIRPRA